MMIFDVACFSYILSEVSCVFFMLYKYEFEIACKNFLAKDTYRCSIANSFCVEESGSNAVSL